MRILYVTKQVPYGDIEAFILPEISSHLDFGWDLYVCPLRGSKILHKVGDEIFARTLSGKLLSMSILGGACLAALGDPGHSWSIAWTIIKRSGPKLIFRNLAALPKGLWLGREARRLGVEHIHAHWIAVPATMAWIAATIARIPWSITAHRYDIAQANLLDVKFNSAAFVRAIDEPGARELQDQISSDQKGPVIIHMGVNVPVEATRNAYQEGATLRGIIGARLTEKKGHQYLVDALAIARREGCRVSIDAYGDGPLEASLRQQTDALGLSDSINWLGSVGHETILSRLRSGEYNFAILPSVTALDGDKEGIPVFLMEAMASGLPVIATPNGGIKELIVPGTGILVQERNAGEIASALCSFAKRPEYLAMLGSAGRKQVMDNFSIEARMTELRGAISRSTGVV